MSVMLFHIRQLPSLPVRAQSTLAVLSQAESNYGLKLVQLTGEPILSMLSSPDVHKEGTVGIVSKKHGRCLFGKSRCEWSSVYC